MSPIQTQVTLVHLPSGIPVSSASQREATESGFIAQSVALTTTPEEVGLGDITEPRQVFIKLSSGDPVLVGFSDSVFPLQISVAEECILLSLHDTSPPDVWMKSEGTSQVVVGVTPV